MNYGLLVSNLTPRRSHNGPLRRLVRWFNKKRQLDALFYFHRLKLHKSRKDAWSAAERTLG